LSIPKSTAYYWIDRYEISVGKKEEKSARSVSTGSAPTVPPAARDTFTEDPETEALIATAQVNEPTVLKNGMRIRWNGAVYGTRTYCVPDIRRPSEGGSVNIAPFFSYYGSKWRMALYYPPPTEDTIVEPFAGSACYALSNFTRKVILNDIDPTITGVWDYLIKATPTEILRLPVDTDSMLNLSTLNLPQEAKALLGFWVAHGYTRPAKRATGWAVTDAANSGCKYWSAASRARLARQVNLIKHWTVSNKSYDELDNHRATWFVDPPYSSQTGKAYEFNNAGIDYSQLREWCRSRRGQVIVCENLPNDAWLPFRRFRDVRTLTGSVSKEVRTPTHPWRQARDAAPGEAGR
jgi:site-specific DNA-adenine methylase